jgi:hypothetical protein
MGTLPMISLVVQQGIDGSLPLCFHPVDNSIQFFAFLCMALPKQPALPIDEFDVFLHGPVVNLFEGTALLASRFLLHIGTPGFVGMCGEPKRVTGQHATVYFFNSDMQSWVT